MKEYRLIENKGEVDVRGFYVMGMTSKVDDTEVIGQFGTGNKYGIAALLRHNVKLIIFSGEKKISFTTKLINFREQKFHSIVMKIGKEKIDTGFTIEMGQISWNLTQGLKELVSNAMDEGGLRFDLTTKTKGLKGYTRIFVEDTREVQQFFNERDRYFTFNREVLFEDSEIGSVYLALDKGIRIYRKQVLVYESQEEQSIFDYDLIKVNIKEDRTTNRFEAKWELRDLLMKMPVYLKERLFNECLTQKNSSKYFESTLDFQYYEPQDDWSSIVGDHIVISELEEQYFSKRIHSYSRYIVPTNWVHFLIKHPKIGDIHSIISDSILKGWEVKEIDTYTQSLIDQAIDFFHDLGYKIPKELIMIADNSKETAPAGQYIDGKLYINSNVIKKGLDEFLVTLAEEYFHYKTQHDDYTREFQNHIMEELLYQMKRLHIYIKEDNHNAEQKP